MNFHTIFHRELLIASKRPATFWLRSLLGGCGAVAAMLIIYGTVFNLVHPARTSVILLWTLGVMGTIAVLFEGVLLTIDSISRERREGTLGLLFLSNLNGYDIVAGKAFGAGVRTFFGLLAVAPVPALTFFLGGVAVGEYVKLMIALVNALFFAISLGLLMSCLSETMRHARARLIGAMLWFLIGAPAAGIFLQQQNHPFKALLVGASPAFPLVILIQENLFTSAEFLAVIALTNLMAWGMLLWAGRSLDRSWREVETGTEGHPLPSLFRRKRVVPVLNHAPVLWIAHRRGLKFTSFWIAIGAFWMIAIFIGLVVHTDYHLASLACILVVLHLMLSFEVTAAASRSLADDRGSGLLEMLLTTPVPEDEIAAGHLLALKQQVAPAFGLLLGMGISWLALASLQMNAGEWFGCVFAYSTLITVHLLEMWVSARLALWKGLQSGSGARGFRRAMGSGGLAALAGVLFGVFVAICVSPAVDDDVAILAGAIGTLFAVTAGAAGLMASTTTHLSENLREVASIPIKLK